jgi:N-methylhydantoinase A/oxoprolinase/acetone carboxylase beta subunit
VNWLPATGSGWIPREAEATVVNETAPGGAILGVDVGGTFTDAVLVVGGKVFAGKAASTPEDQSKGALAAAGQVLEKAGMDPSEVSLFAHGMTVATNALLESRVADAALVATRGFADLIEIGRQNRPSLYRLDMAPPPPLIPPDRRFELDERMGPDGVLSAPDEAGLDRVTEAVAQAGVASVAVCLLHADRHPAHEIAIGERLRQRLGPSAHISLSHEVVGTFREYERAATTEVDAALSPLLAGYFEQLAGRCEAAGLPEPLIMQSSGGLTDLATASRHAALAVLSGPAGGAAAAAMISRSSGEPNLLCFDMGGTSCDVCVIEAGSARETGGRAIAGRTLALPAIDIETVGAGGGSIAWRDAGGALRVGPRSAGAIPGPACYRKGGTEPTVTDAHLVLGHLGEHPALADGIALDSEAAQRAVAGLAGELGIGAEECAAGILRVADTEMVRALRVMTVERGLDPEDFALLAFGGAGPLHATSIADELGIENVLVPVDGGVFSALGLAAAERRSDEIRTVLLSEQEITKERLAELIAEADQVSWDLRYSGQSFELTVEDLSGEPSRLRQLFESTHEARYGYAEPEAAIELVTVRRRYVEAGPRISLSAGDFETRHGPESIDLGQATIYLPDGWTAISEQAGLIRLRRSSLM